MGLIIFIFGILVGMGIGALIERRTWVKRAGYSIFAFGKRYTIEEE